MNIDEHKKIDAQIVNAAKNVKVLSLLSWPTDVMETFLAGWRAGKPKLPVVEYTNTDDTDEPARALDKAISSLQSLDDPLANYLRDTTTSYRLLCDLLIHTGKPEIRKSSSALYGEPRDLLSKGSVSNLDAADYFLNQSAQFGAATHLHEADYCIPADFVGRELDARLAEGVSAQYD